MLCSQPYMSSHFHFLIIVESALAQALLQSLKLHSTLFGSESEMVHPRFITWQESDFHCDWMFKFKPRCDKYISDLGNYVEKLQLSGINGI
jgi:hypothetical protein